MTSIIRRPAFPARNISKREFLTPFDELFNTMLGDMFPTLHQEFGNDFFVQGSYPKCNVITNDECVIIEAAIPAIFGTGSKAIAVALAIRKLVPSI